MPSQEPTGKKTISEKDMIAIIDNEFDIIYNYSRDQDSRKSALFKLNVTLFLVFSSGLISLFAALGDGASFSNQSMLQFRLLFSIVVMGLGMLNYTIVKQYAEAHVAYILAAQQANLLRRSRDCEIYGTVENEPPKNANLRDEESEYWARFGKYRVAQIGNVGLLNRVENSFYWSSAGSTMLVMCGTSTAMMFLPVIYFSYYSESFIKIFLTGSAVTSAVLYILFFTMNKTKDVIVKTLRSGLTHEESLQYTNKHGT